MDKLELKWIAPYLPYGLKALSKYNEISEIDSIHWSLDGHLRAELSICFQKSPSRFRGSNIEDIKPILRPMSDLTKEINYNVETFVPIERLLDLETKCNWSYSDHLITSSGIKSYWTKIEAGSTFGYNEYGYFYLIDKFDVYYPVKHQKQLFEKLYEWHFDIHDLIPAGMALDINTINQ